MRKGHCVNRCRLIWCESSFLSDIPKQIGCYWPLHIGETIGFTMIMENLDIFSGCHFHHFSQRPRRDSLLVGRVVGQFPRVESTKHSWYTIFMTDVHSWVLRFLAHILLDVSYILLQPIASLISITQLLYFLCTSTVWKQIWKSTSNCNWVTFQK